MSSAIDSLTSYVQGFFLEDLQVLQSAGTNPDVVRVIDAGKNLCEKAEMITFAASLIFGGIAVGSLGLGLWAWSIWLTPVFLVAAASSGVFANEVFQLYQCCHSFKQEVYTYIAEGERVASDLGLSIGELLSESGRERMLSLPTDQQGAFFQRAVQLQNRRIRLTNGEGINEYREYLKTHTLILSLLVDRWAEQFGSLTSSGLGFQNPPGPELPNPSTPSILGSENPPSSASPAPPSSGPLTTDFLGSVLQSLHHPESHG